MTRRDFVLTACAISASSRAADSLLVVPVRRVIDARSCTQKQFKAFSSGIWAEAVRDFNGCGIQIKDYEAQGEVRRSPGGAPIFAGLERGVINLVLTDHIPEDWDKGRALSGVTTIYEGHHLCVIALRYAHGHQIPFLAVNTCVHELLHVFLQDIFVNRPKWFQSGGRELRIDYVATRLWLFRAGGEIRKSAEGYLKRLRPAVARVQ
jgi:hypothetical protein